MATPIVIHNETGYIRAGLTSGDEPSVIFAANSVTGASPLNADIVQDWDGMKQVWSAVFDKLGVDPRQHPILLTECPLNPKRNREEATKIFCETFKTPGFYLTTSSVLAAYAAGKTTGVILEISEDVTYIVPVYEGYVLPHAVFRFDIGRKHINSLESLFREDVIESESYGIHDMMLNSINRCDVDIRPEMYKNIVITGSGSNVGGLVDRFTKEMVALAPPATDIHVSHPTPFDNLIWKGGDQVAPLLDQYGMWITQADYAAQGVVVVHRKCF